MASDEKVHQFLNWCEKKGISYDGLEIRSCKNLGNGVFTTRSFRTNEKIIEIPKDLMITAGMIADKEQYSKLIGPSRFFPTPFQLLTLFFCLEDPGTSAYAPYLNVLPKTFTTPSYTGKVIDPSHLPLSVRDYWCTQQRDLCESWKAIKVAAPQITYEKFLWAWHVVNTRCIYVENKPHAKVDNSSGDTLAVVPIVDMFNHEANAQGIASFETYTKKYVVRASRYISEGQQVTLCYGPHDNARLWIEYGFTLSNNPNGKVLLENALLIALAKKVGVKVTSLHEQALQEAGLPSTLYLTDAAPSWALRVNMKILMLSPHDIKRWRELVYDEKTRPTYVLNSSDEESPVDDQESKELETLKKIILELKHTITSKMETCSKETTWIWKEQIHVVDTVLSYFNKRN